MDIHDLRLHLGMDQTRFADELGVRQATVSDWETGKKRPVRAMRACFTRIAQQAGFL